MKLPGEVRNETSALVLLSPDHVSSVSSQQCSLLFVNKQINQETVGLFYSLDPIYVTDTSVRLPDFFEKVKGDGVGC